MINLNSPAFGKLRVYSTSAGAKEYSCLKDIPKGPKTPEEKLAQTLLKEHANNKEVNYLDSKGLDVKVGLLMIENGNKILIGQVTNIANKEGGNNLPCHANPWNHETEHYLSDNPKKIYKEQAEKLKEDIHAYAHTVKSLAGILKAK